jgi:hypothetical protein
VMGILGASGGPRTIASYQYGKPNGEDVKGQVGGSAERARDRKRQREVPQPS